MFPKINFSAGFIVAYKKYQKDQRRFNKKPPNEVKLVGTVKLHGTHADIVVYSNDQILFQSRNRALDLEHDNHDFVKTMTPHKKQILSLRDQCIAKYEDIKGKGSVKSQYPIIIAGEWVGPKIQKGVALAQLEKNKFVVISISINNSWVPDQTFFTISNENVGIYNLIARTGYWMETLDVTKPAAFKETMKKLTLQVEKECPFAKTFGIIGTGEGMVWKGDLVAETRHILGADPKFWFKDKGEDHRNTTTEDLSARKAELKANARKFAETALKESRLEQGLDYLREMQVNGMLDRHTQFVKWLCEDVITEERRMIKKMTIDINLLRKAIDAIGTEWYMKQIGFRSLDLGGSGGASEDRSS
ncbi:uncharacterized protein LY89DRAFT_756886 [Mollisia scopiformis]|uniref:RNA ligase domain-containing protein n=1 Tax=Mollisia scopiformis TaxID=149040 RepID=A0A194WWS4_MOLSC|nr:uncharacterized protein LY89DRAFT_756886 [Mollisia scopiformis]KUJ12423.1 hypothetical protein LY89DRAFT_756886 [Mollisia scopiformis]